MKGKREYGTFIGAARLLLVLPACAGLALPTACSSEADREPLPDWREGYEEIIPYSGADGGVEPPEGFPEDSFGIAISEDITYPIRIRQLNTRNQACSVKQGSPEAEITCVIEMDELDLYALGLKYDIVAPKGMCDFIFYSSYMFENFEIGEGPKNVSWTVDENGQITDEVNSVDGAPRCAFDYSWQYSSAAAAPNCCIGSYNRKVNHIIPAKEEGGEPEEKITESTEMWNGNPAECYHGAAYIDKDVIFGADGWPMMKFIYIDRKALVKKVEYHGLSAHFWSNVPLASFYDPVDHENDMPVAFKGIDSRPFYNFECLDDAEEIIARIRLIVREWNEEAEFDADGDPDSEGIEPGWETLLNDITDWADLTPGNTEYPEILPVVRPPGL
jgi:hypothetical protein